MYVLIELGIAALSVLGTVGVAYLAFRGKLLEFKIRMEELSSKSVRLDELQNEINNKTSAIEYQVQNNGGSSMKDSVDQILTKVQRISERQESDYRVIDGKLESLDVKISKERDERIEGDK